MYFNWNIFIYNDYQCPKEYFLSEKNMELKKFWTSGREEEETQEAQEKGEERRQGGGGQQEIKKILPRWLQHRYENVRIFY